MSELQLVSGECLAATLLSNQATLFRTDQAPVNRLLYTDTEQRYRFECGRPIGAGKVRSGIVLQKATVRLRSNRWLADDR